MDFIAKIIASVSRQQPSVLGAVMAEISNLHMYSKPMSLRPEADARGIASIMPCIRFVTESGTPISYYLQNSRQERCRALLRPHRHILQAERKYDGLTAWNLTAGLEGLLNRYELAYSRTRLLDGTRSNDLLSEISFLRKRLCSILLQRMHNPASRKQTRFQVVNIRRDGEADVHAAEAEEEEQNVREQTTSSKGSDPGMSDYPMTAGHLEIQAVNEAVKDVANAILSLKKVIKDLPSPLSQDYQTILINSLESVSRNILRFPDCLTSLLVRRKAGLDATRKDRDAAAETLRAAEEKMAAAEAKEMKMVVNTGASEHNKAMADAKMKKATDLLRAVEIREQLIADRERRVARLEEEQALEDLNHGANAAMEDEAEAAAAEARESRHSTGPIMGLTAALEDEKIPPNLELPPARQHVLLSRDTAIASKEEELWHIGNSMAFKETNLHLRETTLFAREQLLEQMKVAQIQLMENRKAQVDSVYAGLVAEGEDLGVKFGALIALKVRVEETQAKVRSLIGDARGMVGRVGEDEGKNKGPRGLDF